MLKLTVKEYKNIFQQDNKKNKYNNVKVENENGKFDSKGEAARFEHLLHLQQLGYIKDLEKQYNIIIKIGSQKICTYKADFKYIVAKNNELIIEDYKSAATITAAFRLKAKLMLALYGIDILIVTKEKGQYVEQKFSVCGKRGKNKPKQCWA